MRAAPVASTRFAVALDEEELVEHADAEIAKLTAHAENRRG
jgi:hypothetical protein